MEDLQAPFSSKEPVIRARSLAMGEEMTQFRFLTWAPQHFPVGAGNRTRHSLAELM